MPVLASDARVAPPSDSGVLTGPVGLIGGGLGGMMGRVKVQLLYFDGCPNWREADGKVRAALGMVGRGDVEVERVLVSTPEEAEAVRFQGSPTVWVDGTDPFARPDAPVGLSCRLYRTSAGLAGSPTVEQLVEVLAGR